MDRVGFDMDRFKENQQSIKVDYGKPCPICTDNGERHTPILYPDQKCIKCGYIDPREMERGIHK
jgi:hypothetical protein